MLYATIRVLPILASITLSAACGGITEVRESASEAPEPSEWCRSTALRMTDRYLREYPQQECLREEFYQANLEMCTGALVLGPFSDSVSVTLASEGMEKQCSEVLVVDSSTVWDTSEPPYWIICQQ